jgi:hypothetical protein
MLMHYHVCSYDNCFECNEQHGDLLKIEAMVICIGYVNTSHKFSTAVDELKQHKTKYLITNGSFRPFKHT